MKKLLSLALVGALAAALVVPMSAGTATESVEALYFNELPEIDGVITEEEWGEPTTIIDESNSAFYFGSPDSTAKASENDSEATLWLRWTEDNMYIGIQKVDTNGHHLQNKEGSLWNGDAVQMGIDFAPIKFAGTAGTGTWSADFNNFAVGHISTENVTTTYKWVGPAGTTTAAAIPGTDIAIEHADDITTYEIVIPMKELAGKVAVEDGTVFAMTLVALNAKDGNYTSWLTWGDGICGPQADNLRVGANPVTISSEEAIIIEEEAPAEETAPTAAATADAGVVMFAALALISLAGVMVAKKVR